MNEVQWGLVMMAVAIGWFALSVPASWMIGREARGNPSPAAALAEFHTALGQSYGGRAETNELRAALISEEAREACQALDADDPVAVAQELADVVYVAYGTAFSHGIDLDAVLAEVHAANMRKMVDGRAVFRPDGKLLKPPDWVGPDVAAVLGGRR